MTRRKMKESGKKNNFQLYEIGSLEENRELLKQITKIDSETEYIRVHTRTKDKNFVEDINVNL